jgi:serine/threonine-protein kinase RsbW
MELVGSQQQRTARARARLLRDLGGVVQDAGGDAIELVLPARTSVIRLARLLASGVAAQVGLDVEAVDDVRIGVDELCSTLLEFGDGDRLHLRFEWREGSLQAWGRIGRSGGGTVFAERLDLSRQILDVVADDHHVEVEGEVLTFWIRKQCPVTA